MLDALMQSAESRRIMLLRVINRPRMALAMERGGSPTGGIGRFANHTEEP
jgi:hypothetical protein